MGGEYQNMIRRTKCNEWRVSEHDQTHIKCNEWRVSEHDQTHTKCNERRVSEHEIIF
jgi:hypothetical protein